MLLPNRGTLRLPLPAEAVSPALDADGFPVKSAPAFAPPVPCSWRFDQFDATASTDGEASTARRLRLLLEWSEEALTAQQVLFQGQRWRVVEARPLRAVRKVLLLVRPAGYAEVPNQDDGPYAPPSGCTAPTF